jgi:nucleotide-binding universal stress UspA family protein
MTRLLAAVDLSDVTTAVVHEAELLATALAAPLTLLHVAQPDPNEFVGYQAGPQSVIESRAHKLEVEQATLEKLAASLRYRGLEAEALLVEGPTAETILQEADRLDASMLILGSHGHGMLYHAFVGSVSAAVVKESRRPVLIVPDPRPARRGPKK